VLDASRPCKDQIALVRKIEWDYCANGLT